MQEEAIYRCINPACARPMPRPVNFCPWCGTAQAGAPKPADAVRADVAPSDIAATLDADAGAEARTDAAAIAAASAAAQLSGWSDAPEADQPPADGARRPGQGAPVARDAEPAGASGAASGAGPGAARTGFWGTRTSPRHGASAGERAHDPAHGIRLGTLFGHSGRAPDADAPPAPPQSVPRPPLSPAPVPPQRKPVRLRWWLAVLAVLACVWYVARPDASGRIDARIAHASALAKACRAKDAQEELIALRKTRATSNQLERLQAVLNEGAAACTRQRQRDKAWNDASGAAEAALADGNAERARARLQAYTRRWGDDARARALRERIEDARHPLAAPSGSI